MFITSIFLHANFEHLFFNMIALFFFGSSLENRIGKRLFFMLFFISGIVGNIGYFFTSTNPYTPAIGASGAVYGIMGALATLAPFMMVYIYGFLPLPMIAAAILWAVMDLAGLFTGAHLGGMFFGVAFALYYRSLLGRRRNWEIRYEY
jgi:membrane associated rhomboid family serine protease